MSNKLKKIINLFYENQISVLQIDANYFDINLINKYNLEIATEKTKNFIYQINSSNEITFCGYKKSVNRIVSYLTESV